ncbi:DUF1292 domain-containing protein [Eubacterium oxidoreducens]|uniref:DUF1292 domain-containing protein n=1 Tax=Eubacterium oxidoreducens TaxID=1732 RepID=A0A1G6BG20_EUBOX|nr:DUF1292 domain-containing protein [Eubacterium oxidoreducens]SDB19572.1 Protein of unknown function [Eubacterium oxidoreducens]
MDKIVFHDEIDGQDIELYVLEQTTLQGEDYLLVSEDLESEEAQCYIMCKLPNDESDGDFFYEFVEDEKKLDALAKIFEELLEDTDIQ